jgi:hypothetical protein
VDEVAAKHPHLFDANISKNHMNYYPSEEERLSDKRLQARAPPRRAARGAPAGGACGL